MKITIYCNGTQYDELVGNQLSSWKESGWIDNYEVED